MKYSLLIMLILIASSIYAINENAGTTGFTFLKVNYSARAAAMADAYTGLSDDASAVFFNPAGLIQLRSSQVSATYMSYFEGIQCGSLVYALPMNEKTTVAFFSQFLTAKEDRTLSDEFGNYAGTAGTFGMSDIIFGVSLSRFITNIINIGVNIKYIRESLDSNTGTALIFDFALLHQTTNKNLKVGIVVKNIGRQLTYYTDNEYEEKLPQLITVGFNYHPDEKFYATFDIYKPFDYDFAGRIGLEYKIHEMFALRTGYKTNSGDWRTGGDHDFLSGVSFGVGFNWKKYKLDYAIISYGYLGFVNQISILYSF